MAKRGRAKKLTAAMCVEEVVESLKESFKGMTSIEKSMSLALIHAAVHKMQSWDLKKDE